MESLDKYNIELIEKLSPLSGLYKNILFYQQNKRKFVRHEALVSEIKYYKFINSYVYFLDVDLKETIKVSMSNYLQFKADRQYNDGIKQHKITHLMFNSYKKYNNMHSLIDL